jgi:anti-sigma regulatory factor (Ser/Thr protein kinase)
MVADNAQPRPPPGGEAGESQQQTAPDSRASRERISCPRPASQAGHAFAARRVARCDVRPPAARGMQARTLAAAMTAGTAIRASLTIPGHPGQVHAARVFTGTTLGDEHPCAAVAVLLVSEMVTNSMLYSYSGLPGGTITVTVTGSPDVARVEVRDAGGMSVPLLGSADDALAEGGRGLRLVSDLAARWDYRRDAAGLVTWFEVRAEPPS